MAQKINIYSDDWCNMIFEGKNHDYGAFELRKASSNRHFKAVIIAISLFSLAICSPMIIDSIIPETKEKNVEVTNLAKINLDKPKPKDEEKVIDEPPPPPLKSSIKFVPPVIKPDEEVNEEDQMKAQDEMLNTKLTISTADVKGTDEENGIDISELQQNQAISDQSTEQVFEFVEQQAEFPGGSDELLIYLKKNVRYPDLALESNIQGTVYVTFVVNRNGKISGVKVLRGIGGGCEDEAVRVVQNMPNWLPGKQNGEVVSSRFNLPISFKLQ